MKTLQYLPRPVEDYFTVRFVRVVVLRLGSKRRTEPSQGPDWCEPRYASSEGELAAGLVDERALGLSGQPQRSIRDPGWSTGPASPRSCSGHGNWTTEGCELIVVELS